MPEQNMETYYMKLIPLVQGSKEWLTYRDSHLGASESSSIMDCNPFKSKFKLWEEKTLGWHEPVNENMLRGQRMEPAARLAYEIKTGIFVEPMVGEHDIYSFISASFDGVSPCLSNIVEIKCGKKSHAMAQQGIIAPYYLCQVYHQMMVAGIDQMDYWSFDGTEGILIPVVRDNQFITTLLEKLIEFWDCVQTNTPPKD